jgi:hypothetical protein
MMEVKASQIRANEILALNTEQVNDLLLYELAFDILGDKIVA